MKTIIYVYGLIMLTVISIIDYKTKDVFIIMPIAGILPLMFVSSMVTITFSIVVFIIFLVVTSYTEKLGKGDSYVFLLAALLLNSPDTAFKMIFMTFTLAFVYSMILKIKGISEFNALCPFILVSTLLVKTIST